MLIDFNKIVLPNNLTLLKERIQPIPNTKYDIGLVLVLYESVLHSLEMIPKGKKRIQYINSKTFVDGILDFAYVIYNKSGKIAEITNISNLHIISHILNRTLQGLPNDIILTVGIELSFYDKNMVVNYINHGFENPFICRENVLCLSRKNDIIENLNVGEVIHHLEYVLSQYKNKNCKLQARLSDASVLYLKETTKIGSTVNKDGAISQKEIAGKFIVLTIENNLTHVLDIDRKNIVYGEEEGVEIVDSLYNFHSHPADAYKNHNVKLGFPSAQDYLGFLNATVKYNTILHIVSTIEGLYIISLTEDWLSSGNIRENMSSFISKFFDICGKSGHTVESYLSEINNIKYNNVSIFTVQFLDWENTSNIFSVSFRKNGMNCFSKEETIQK